MPVGVSVNRGPFFYSCFNDGYARWITAAAFNATHGGPGIDLFNRDLQCFSRRFLNVPFAICHLPFAIRFWRLDSWPDFAGYFEDRYQAFPILWRILLASGLFFKEPRLFILPNLLALAGLCWSARKYLCLPWSSSVLACLCFPVALFGFSSSMQDFFVNSTALAGALALFSANLQNNSSETRLAWVFGLIMLALSANVKSQGLLLGIIILFLAFLFSFSSLYPHTSWRQAFHIKPLVERAKKNFVFIFTLMLLLSLIGAQPAINLYRYQNPFYPVSFWQFKVSEGNNVSTISYVPRIPLLYNGATFLASSLEVDPILRSRHGLFFRRSVHMQNPPESDRQPADQFGNRWIITGGSNGILYLFLFFGAIVSLCQNRYHAPRTINARGHIIASLHVRLIVSFLVTLFLPQSLELRYYLYNLFVPCFVVISSQNVELRRLMSLATLLGTAFAILSTILVPFFFGYVQIFGCMKPFLGTFIMGVRHSRSASNPALTFILKNKSLGSLLSAP